MAVSTGPGKRKNNHHHIPRNNARIIPESFKDLAAAFSKLYNFEEKIIIEIFIKHECIKEVQLESILKFDTPLLESHLSNLLSDRVIQKRTKDYIGPGGVTYKSRRIVYYFLNYRSLINVIQLILQRMREEIEVKTNTNAKSALSEYFKCTNPKCARTFSEYRAGQLFHPEMNNFFCMHCKTLVIENELNANESDSASKTGFALMQFNSATQHILDLMKKASQCDPNTILTEPPLPDDNQLRMDETMSVNIVDPSTSHSSSELADEAGPCSIGTKRTWSGEITRYARNNNQGVQVVVSGNSNDKTDSSPVRVRAGETSDDDQKINSKKLKGKSAPAPVWMSSTTAIAGTGTGSSDEDDAGVELMDTNSVSASGESGITYTLEESCNLVLKVNESILFDNQDLDKVDYMSGSGSDSDSD